MPNITRRNLLKQSPAVLAVAAVPASAAVAALPAEPALIENAELIAAYDRFLAARAEVAAAEDALEWLADEWRHRWPSAPEEILGFANADEKDGGHFKDIIDAERDITGRLVFRDTAALTKRFTKKQRQETPRTCFGVYKPDSLLQTIKGWEQPRTARTERALAKKLADQKRILHEYREKLRLSEIYHAECARLREASGVLQVKRRIEAAKVELDRACSSVSYMPARTAEGLRLKAAVLLVQDNGMAPFMRNKGGALGAMARFIDATLDVIGRQS
jgi:hypothetical protein